MKIRVNRKKDTVSQAEYDQMANKQRGGWLDVHKFMTNHYSQPRYIVNGSEMFYGQYDLVLYAQGDDEFVVLLSHIPGFCRSDVLKGPLVNIVGEHLFDWV